MSYYDTQAWRDENADEGRDYASTCDHCAEITPDDKLTGCSQPGCKHRELCPDCTWPCTDCGEPFCSRHVTRANDADLCTICERSRKQQAAA
jgi:hypothetical protein